MWPLWQGTEPVFHLIKESVLYGFSCSPRFRHPAGRRLRSSTMSVHRSDALNARKMWNIRLVAGSTQPECRAMAYFIVLYKSTITTTSFGRVGSFNHDSQRLILLETVIAAVIAGSTTELEIFETD